MPPDNKALYLTFDDGPNPETSPVILEILKQFDARATFFCVGENVSKHPQIYDQILASGHEVGNHAYNHLKGWEAETSEYIKNVEKCSEVVKSTLFRPPYGKMKRSQQRVLRRKYNIVMWTVLSRDYDSKVSADICLEKTWKYTRPGAIILFHDHLKTIDKLKVVLPEYLRRARDAGYTIKVLGTRCWVLGTRCWGNLNSEP